MNIHKLSTTKITLFTLALLASVLLLTTLTTQRVGALYASDRLIDDTILLDANSMNPGQIQEFLNNRGGQIASKTFLMNCDSAGTKAKQLYTSAGAPCSQVTTAANIIYYTAQIYGINPRVIMTTMQKEQSLITATNPTDRQYVQSMGYGCPTSGDCNDSSNFFWQVDNGTWALRFHYERAKGNNDWWRSDSTWTCGREKSLYKPSLYPGQVVRFYDEQNVHYASIHIKNAATSAFYCYTPHVYNNFPGCRPAYGVSYASWKPTIGNTGTCYSGSYNFVLFYEQWFGSTQNGDSYEIVKKYEAMGGSSSWLGASVTSIKSAARGGLYQQFENGKIYWNKNTGAWTVRTGDIDNRYASVGYEVGHLGFPKTDEVSIPGKGVYQQFEGGQMYWSSSTRAWDVRGGAMFSKFTELRYESSYLGFPTSGEIPAKEGVYQSFQGGRLYWRPGHPAMDISSTLLSAHTAAGSEKGYLGLPRQSMVCGIKNGGCWMLFDGGKIYWSSATGAIDVHQGDVDSRYASLGYENGALGYPTSREITTGQKCGGYNNVTQEYQNGKIHWSKCSNPTTRVE